MLLLLCGVQCELIERVDSSMQMALGQVQIDGRVFQPLMAHQQLDGAQVGTALQQMRGEAMPEGMRMELLMNPCTGRVPVALFVLPFCQS